MEYLPFAMGLFGLLLILYSQGYFDFLKRLVPKKIASPSIEGVLDKFVEIRKMLVGKVDDATLASVDKVILDAVSGAKKDE